MLALALFLSAQDRTTALPAPDTTGEGSVAAQSCDPRGNEIMVCGNGDVARFRARPLDESRWAGKPLRPEFKVPGGRGAVHVEQRSAGGASVPAAAVTLTFPLGPRTKPK